VFSFPGTQELKEALDEAIASLARRADLAAALWERLAAAVVVQPATADGGATVPRYDLSYQLNEIEVGAGSVVGCLLIGWPCRAGPSKSDGPLASRQAAALLHLARCVLHQTNSLPCSTQPVTGPCRGLL